MNEKISFNRDLVKMTVCDGPLSVEPASPRSGITNGQAAQQQGAAHPAGDHSTEGGNAGTGWKTKHW